MSAALFGFLSGIGAAQREFNNRDYESKIHAERSANEGTVKMLESLLNRDDVPVETKNAAAQSLFQFSKLPGLPTSKHRAQIMEPILHSFNAPRAFTSPSVQSTRNAGAQTEQMGGAMSSLTGVVPGAEGIGEFLSASGHTAANTPGESRTGFMRPDELAMARASSFRTMMDAMSGGMSGMDGRDSGGNTGPSNAPSNAPSSGNRVALPRVGMDAHGRPTFSINTREVAPKESNYIVGGQPVYGIFDPSTGRVRDRVGNDITDQIESKAGPQGTRWLVGADANGNPEYTPVPRIASPSTPGPKVPVRQRTFSTTDEMGGVYQGTQNPYTGAITTETRVGTRPNATLMRKNLEASLNLKGLSAQQKEQALQLGSLRTYGAYLDGSVPPWMQLDEQGNAVPLAVSPGARPTAMGQNKAQAAALGLHMIEKIEPLIQRIESKFGPISGRIDDWLVTKGIKDDPDVKDLQILTTHLSASLPAIQQFRSGEIMRDYHVVLGGLGQPFENFKNGLLSTKGVLDEAFNEGIRPITPHTSGPRATGTSPRPVPGRNPASAPKYKVGDPVMYRGKPTKIKAVYPDGTYEVE